MKKTLIPKLFFITSLLFCILLFYPIKVFVISTEDAEEILTLGDYEVTIKYTHSVQKSEVIEILRVNRSGLYAEEMLWKDFGAGLPEDIQFSKDYYYVKEINTFLGKNLEFWFIPLNNAEILINGKLVFSPKQEVLVRFEIKDCSLLKIIIREC